MAPLLPDKAFSAWTRASSVCPRCAASSAPRSRKLRSITRSLSSSSRSSPTALPQRQHRPQRSSRLRSTAPLSSHYALAALSSGNCPPSLQQQRSYSASRPDYIKPREVAVLGGGLTGLTTAWYLARLLPPEQTRITLYEAGDRLGGWIDTEEVEVRGEDGTRGTVRFEKGARVVQAQNRTLKWDDLVLYEMIDALGLNSEVITTPRNQRVNRYIYYPDHLVDVTGPITNPLGDPMGTVASWMDTARDVLTEPLFEGAIPSVANMMLGNATRGFDRIRKQWIPGYWPGWPEDQSIGDFFANSRFGGRRELVDNALSALMHGIYGGDVWKLSVLSSGMFARSAFVHELGEAPGAALVMADDFLTMREMVVQDAKVRRLAEASTRWGYIMFRRGFATLTDALEKSLRSMKNVRIVTGAPVTSIKCHDNQLKVEITTSRTDAQQLAPTTDAFDRVVSTLYSRALASVTHDKLPALAETKAVTIAVVNLWYPQPKLHAPHNGFGYLIPQTVPADQNPECALGVLFDSDRETNPAALQGSSAGGGNGGGGGDSVPGTKLTVMLGGHYWGAPADPSLVPDDAAAEAMARAVVSRHLGIPAGAEAVARVRLQRDCIPQHEVGHSARMARARDELDAAFAGRLAVAGGSYTAPGVLPSLRAARDVAVQVATGGPPFTDPLVPGVGSTGLGRLGPKAQMPVLMPRRSVPFRFRNAGVGGLPLAGIVRAAEDKEK